MRRVPNPLPSPSDMPLNRSSEHTMNSFSGGSTFGKGKKSIKKREGETRSTRREIRRRKMGLKKKKKRQNKGGWRLSRGADQLPTRVPASSKRFCFTCYSRAKREREADRITTTSTIIPEEIKEKTENASHLVARLVRCGVPYKRVFRQLEAAHEDGLYVRLRKRAATSRQTKRKEKER